MPTSTPCVAKKRSSLSYTDISPAQHALIDRLYRHHCLAVAPVGFGKAVCAQTAAQELIEAGVLTRVLIVAPLTVCQLTWATEWATWDHLWQPALILGDETRRIAALASPAAIAVINVECLPWLLERKSHLQFDGLVIDEISKFKTAGSVGVKRLRGALGQFKWRVGLSATPVAEAGRDLYAQALIIDQGKALGTRQQGFLDTCMYPTDYQRRKWAWKPGRSAWVAEKLKDILYMADGAGYAAGLPELIDEVIEVELNTRIEYDAMCTGILTTTAGVVSAASSAVVAGKLQQIANGTVYQTDLHTGDRQAVELDDAKRLVFTRVLAMAYGSVLVSYQFDFEKTWLQALGVELFDGTPSQLSRWNARQIPALALHPKSAAHGLNLQYGGHELICLGPVWSADQWAQLVGRLRRRGQPSGFVKRTTLVSKGTIEVDILDRVRGKAQDEGFLMAHLREHAG